MKISATRTTLVITALMAAGALFGGVAAAIALTVAGGITEGGFPPWSVLAFAASVGAMLGAPLLPATSFLLLRRVPLGLAFLGTTVGTMLGGIAGWFLGRADPVRGPLTGAVIGFFVAVIVLRLRFSSRRGVAEPVSVA